LNGEDYRTINKALVKGLSLFVMAGLVPAIHVFLTQKEAKTWMPGTRPGRTS
jgi:hypothetical protein